MLKPLDITLKTDLNRDGFIDSLVALGYERANMVIEQGTYSVKGSVVDVFPINQNH